VIAKEDCVKSFRPFKSRAERRDRLEASQAEYAKALAVGDAASSGRVIEEMAEQQHGLGEIYAQIIAPSLVSIGDLWCSKAIGVAEEHLATQIVLSHLDRLSSMFAPRDRRSFHRVLVACVEGEQHWVGARMFADLCSSYGSSVEFLGPNVPDAALIEIVQKRAPQIVALSATMMPGLDHARHVAGELARLPSPPRLILGGDAITQRPSAAGLFGAAVARDVVDGSEIAHKFLRANRPRAILKEYLLGLGRRVRDLRLQKGWTQEQLAESARVTRVCIVAVEGGKQNVSMDIVIRLANGLGVSPEGLMGDGEEPGQLLRRER
jgi:methanogenic corrinoid protein MtbC1/DNA-binding XRE family transcriptional regulator